MVKIKYSKEESKKIFFTSDTHFYHNNIIRFCKRPFESVDEMNETLINNWNSVVPPDGIVFHLGDFCFAGSDKMKELVSKLNGKIILIKGNHDHISKGMESMFSHVSYEMSIEIDKHRVLLNHYAFLTFAGAKNPKPVIQLFGHVHSGPHCNGYDKGRLKYLFPSQYDVGVDNNNFKPVSWKQILKIIDERCKTRKTLKWKIKKWIMNFLKQI